MSAALDKGQASLALCSLARHILRLFPCIETSKKPRILLFLFFQKSGKLAYLIHQFCYALQQSIPIA